MAKEFYLAGNAWTGFIPIFLSTFFADHLYQAQSINSLGDKKGGKDLMNVLS